METTSGRKGDGAGTTDRGGPKGRSAPGESFAGNSNNFAASWADAGINVWNSALNLMS